MKRAGLCAVAALVGVGAGCDPCFVLNVFITDCGNDFGACESDDDCDDDLVCDIAEGDESGVCLSVDEGSG